MLESFNFEGNEQPVSFVETMQVTDGVSCDIYSFIDDESKDLGIIKIKPSKKTPLQKVLKGDRTIEGYISGKGRLVITKTNGEEKVYAVKAKVQPVIVNVGERMQWQAEKDSDLIVYEIYFPPYEDGRFENIK